MRVRPLRFILSILDRTRTERAPDSMILQPTIAVTRAQSVQWINRQREFNEKAQLNGRAED